MDSRSEPAFTVIVPTRGRPEQLRRCVTALLALEPAGGPTELIVVDDDPGGSAAATVSAEPERITYIRSHGRGPAAARNLGAAAARGEVLAFTDDDCEPVPGWLGALAAALAASGADAAAGRTVNGAAGACSEASQLVVSALQQTARHAGGPAFVASNNVCFRREPFLKLGGFDDSFPLAAAEDRDLCERWIEAGHRFADAPPALVVHRHRLSLPAFWRQHFRYGRGAFDFHEIRRRRGDHALRLQPGFYRALGREVREAGSAAGRGRLAGLAAVSQLANATGYAAAALRAKL
jgi:GT2 family glycosyltransferase